MQLGELLRPAALRSRLGAGICGLLASAVPAMAQTEAPGTQFETAALVYGEQARVKVVEPMARVIRVWSGGTSVFAQLGLDVITGASPTGASPSGTSGGAPPDENIQTTTGASGGATAPDALPTAHFSDLRGGLDLGVTQPLGSHVIPTLAAHVSREKDYQSVGGSGTLSLDLYHKRTTLTLGGSFNQDEVFPVGGIVVGLTDGTPSGFASSDKQVREALVGLSQVVSRRWLVGVSASQTRESGYLTEPYKVLSVVDDAGVPVSSLREKRPDSRRRNGVTLGSVYHFEKDVLHASYREYWDGWGVRSHTVDLALRHELGEDRWVEPHVRAYAQSPADFFRFSLHQGQPLPGLLSADQRLGPLRTMTLGAAFGFHAPGSRGEFNVRAEVLVQWGDGHPSDAVGIQRDMDLMPPVGIGSLTLGYSVSR
jgi:uncharacterized protein DUF3570